MESRQYTDEMQKREFHRLHNLARLDNFGGCLFEPTCRNRPIKAHSVSRAILSKIQEGRHVLRPSIDSSLSESADPKRTIRFIREGVNKASTGTFACRNHDDNFKAIDIVPVDTDDHHTLNLMFYRAVLREAWVLQNTQKLTDEVEKLVEIPGPPPIHPNNKLRAVRDSLQVMRPYIATTTKSPKASPIEHIVRRISTPRPIVAASAAGATLDMAFDPANSRVLSMSETQTLTGKNPNCTWAMTVIPQDKEHIVVISWIKGSLSDQFFAHLNKVNGKELEEAISAELILYCENWFLHPKVWDSLSRTRRDAILRAYDNIDQLMTGSIHWQSKKPSTRWFEHINLPNRHQLNLFRYNESAFQVSC
jgi:hypothetical protein